MHVANEALLRVLTRWHGLRARLADEDGQTLAEYGLIISVIAVTVVVTALVLFRGAIVSAFGTIGQCIGGDGNCSGQFP